MGNVLNWIKNLVKWIGGVFGTVLSWFKGEIRQEVEQKTENFVIEKKEILMKCDNPKASTKVVAEKKALKELQKKVDEEEKKLTPNDSKTIDELLKEDVDFDY